MIRGVPQELMGRVSGCLAAVMQASMPVASFLCSGLAVVLDVTSILATFGCLTIVGYLVLARSGRLRALD